MIVKNWSWLLLLAFLAFLPKSNGQECYEPGECTQSLYVGQWYARGAEMCLVQCQSYPDCAYFTFYEEENICIGFANCEQFSGETCERCYSGAANCGELDCWLQERCEGVLISSTTTQTSNLCLEECKSTDGCMWFAYDKSDQSCLLLEDCPVYDSKSCGGQCLSGQMQCPARYTKILVVGGYINDSSNQGEDVNLAEIVDIEDPQGSCEFPPYPLADTGMTMQFVDGILKSCGGDRTADCYDFDVYAKEWVQNGYLSMRRYPAHSSLIDGKWLVSGDSVTTEFWDWKEFEAGPVLPELIDDTCQVTINSTHVFFGNVYDNRAYLLNWETQEFTEIEGNLVIRRYSSCGLINNPLNGPEVVVASDSSSEIYNVRGNYWHEGPEFEDQLEHNNFDEAAAVQLYDTFALVAGEDNYTEDPIDTIYVFDHINYDWILMDAKLMTARESFPASIAVPDDFYEC